jgi:hypothetical protein
LDVFFFFLKIILGSGSAVSPPPNINAWKTCL